MRTRGSPVISHLDHRTANHAATDSVMQDTVFGLSKLFRGCQACQDTTGYTVAHTGLASQPLSVNGAVVREEYGGCTQTEQGKWRARSEVTGSSTGVATLPAVQALQMHGRLRSAHRHWLGTESRVTCSALVFAHIQERRG
jgi:hypothetical protein